MLLKRTGARMRRRRRRKRQAVGEESVVDRHETRSTCRIASGHRRCAVLTCSWTLLRAPCRQRHGSIRKRIVTSAQQKTKKLHRQYRPPRANDIPWLKTTTVRSFTTQVSRLNISQTCREKCLIATRNLACSLRYDSNLFCLQTIKCRCSAIRWLNAKTSS